MKEEKKYFETNHETIDVDKPLTNEELSSLIKASKDKSFNTIEIKKEMNDNFKKVSLHDIAKQAKEKKRSLEEENKKDVAEEKVEVSSSKNDTKNNDNQKNNNENKESIEHETELTENQIEKKNIQDKLPDRNEINTEENFIKKDEHLKQLEEEKQIAFDNGKKQALSEIKEGADAAIAKLQSVTEILSSIDRKDLKELEEKITDKVLALSSELSGKIIKALPTEFLKKIKTFVNSLENIEGNLKILLNENDFKSLDKSKEIKKEIKNLNIELDTELKSGEISIRVNGVSIHQKINVEKN